MLASMFGGNKYEDAAELLEKASNNYKLAKMWREAAGAFVMLSECHLKADSKHDAAAIAELRKEIESFRHLSHKRLFFSLCFASRSVCFFL